MYNNIVGHAEQGPSDKIYISSIRDNIDGTWSMVGKWGRVGSTIREKVRFTGTMKQAFLEMQRVFRKKEERGYVNIESAPYSGSLDVEHSYVAPHLERETRQGEGLSRIANAKSHTEVALPEKDVIAELAEAQQAAAQKTSGSSRKRIDELINEIEEVVEEDLVVVCKNNQGIEAQFTVGVEYLADGITEEFIHTWNKLGELTTVDKERFEVVPG